MIYILFDNNFGDVQLLFLLA